MFPVLYKYTSKGQIQSWQIFTTDTGFYTIEGIKDGKLTQSAITLVSPKNVGRANETTLQEQILLEAKAKHQKKLDNHYNEVLTKDRKFFEPMLAHNFDDYSKLLFAARTFVQPKLDGVRCYLNDSVMISRKGKPIISCPHLLNDFCGLDGELYSHDFKDDFDELISIVRKTKPDAKDLEVAKAMQYWVYDYPNYSNLVFSERYEKLKVDFKNFPNNYILVPTYEIKTIEELRKYHKQFLEDGYEGTIVRMDLGGYENKRSKQLLKYKDFIDEEFKVLKVEEGKGNRSGMAGNLVVQVKNNQTSEVGMTGTEQFMKEVWEKKDEYSKKFATVKHFGYTKKGKLRFPTLKAFRDYE